MKDGLPYVIGDVVYGLTDLVRPPVAEDRKEAGGDRKDFTVPAEDLGTLESRTCDASDVAVRSAISAGDIPEDAAVNTVLFPSLGLVFYTRKKLENAAIASATIGQPGTGVGRPVNNITATASASGGKPAAATPSVNGTLTGDVMRVGWISAEKLAPKLAPVRTPPLSGPVGRFRLPFDRIALSVEMADLWSRCVPVLASYRDDGQVEYTALSPLFDPIATGQEVPLYAISFAGGRVRFERDGGADPR